MTSNVDTPPRGPKSDKQFLGHPVGLFVLFFTEMWERFSYYGMRGLLKLYMVNYLFITVRQTQQGGAYDGHGNPEAVLGWDFVRRLLPKVDITDPKIVAECIEPAILRLTTGEGAVTVDVARRIAEQTCLVSPNASVLYGWYTGLVFMTPLIGGYLADKYLGQKRAVFLGGAIMALGQFALFGAESLFFVGLLLIILGNGLFKPNIATQVGNLYPQGDPRRDGAFTIFYMGINLGAFVCNFVCGTLAAFYGWRYGFLAAGIGLCIALFVQGIGQRFLAPDTLQTRAATSSARGAPSPARAAPLTKDEWNRVWALVLLSALNIVFWVVYEQQGNTMQTWADEQTVWPTLPNVVVYGVGGAFVGALLGAIAALVFVVTDMLPSASRRIGRFVAGAAVLGFIGANALAVAFGQSVFADFQIPSTFFQSANPFFVFLLAPMFDMLWRWQSKRGTEPSSLTKMAFGCCVVGGSFIVMILGAYVVGAGQGSWLWPLLCVLLLTIGELYLSPIGLSLVTKVSPARIVSMMMGMWYLSAFFGNILSGYIGRLYSSMPKEGFFAVLMVLGVGAGISIWLFNKRLQTAMGARAD